MSDHVVPLSVYRKVFAALLVLLIVTVAAAFVHIGSFGNIVLAMSIAVAKMTLIILYFMHVRYSSKLTMVFAASGFLWLVIMFAFFLADIAARTPVPAPWEQGSSAAVSHAAAPAAHAEPAPPAH